MGNGITIGMNKIITKEEKRQEELGKVWMIVSNIKLAIESESTDDDYLNSIRKDLEICKRKIDKLLEKEEGKN